VGRLSRKGYNPASAGSLSRASAKRWIIPLPPIIKTGKRIPETGEIRSKPKPEMRTDGSTGGARHAPGLQSGRCRITLQSQSAALDNPFAFNLPRSGGLQTAVGLGRRFVNRRSLRGPRPFFPVSGFRNPVSPYPFGFTRSGRFRSRSV